MRKYLSFVGAVCIAVSILFVVPPAFAQDYGLGETAGAAGLTKYGNSVPTIAGNVIGTLLSMISVLFFVLVLYGGILWMTARGNSEQTGKALNTIIAATIGIIIVMGAYALTNFVFQLGGSGGGDTPTTPPVPGQGSWCLVNNQCSEGGGSPCAGEQFASAALCQAELGGENTSDSGGQCVYDSSLVTELCDEDSEWQGEYSNQQECQQQMLNSGQTFCASKPEQTCRDLEASGCSWQS